MASDTMMQQQPSFGYSSNKRTTTGPMHSYEFEVGVSPESFAPSFQFRRRLGEINWRKIAMIDVEKIARELDIDMLQEHIQTVAFCNIDIVADLDPMFAKLFKLAQFMIEYMLHSQASLQAIISELESKLEIAAAQQNSAQDQIKHLEGDVGKLKSENKRRRKMIEQQQMLIESGASSYYKCPHCEKAFVNASFLQGHMQRKHPGSVNYIGDVIAHSQREQSKLAGRLEGLDSELQKERVNFAEKLKQAEEEKAAWGARTRRDMDRWKKEEAGRWRTELETMKSNFVKEIEQLKMQEGEYKKKISNLETSVERHSNLGELVDDIEGDKQKLTQRIRTLEETNQEKEAKLRQLAMEMKRLRTQSRNELTDYEQRVSDMVNGKLKDREIRKETNVQTVTAPPPEKSHEIYSESETEELSDVDDKLSQIRKHKSDFVEQMRPVLKTLLDRKLQECGIDPEADGISTKTLTNKLMVRKTARQGAAKKQPGYYAIRDSLRKRMEEEANKSRGKGSPTRKSRKKTPSHLPKQRLLSATSMSTDTNPTQRQQRPAGTLGRASNSAPPKTRKSDEPMTRDELSNRFADDESLWDSDVSDTERAQTIPESSPPRVPPKAAPKTNQDSWDSNEFEDLLSPETEVRDAKPGETKVMRIASKLQERSPTKPPVGGVSVLPVSSTPVQIPNVESDDDFSNVSSLRDETPKPAPRVSPSRVGQSANTMSSGGTSVWGSGHGKHQTDEKTVEAELSDWDDDFSER